jgi:hypothetical protein
MKEEAKKGKGMNYVKYVANIVFPLWFAMIKTCPQTRRFLKGNVDCHYIF